MSLLEEDSLLREPVDVRSLRLWMPTEAANPVVQIVNGNEQNVGPVDRVGGVGPLV